MTTALLTLIFQAALAPCRCHRCPCAPAWLWHSCCQALQTPGTQHRLPAALRQMLLRISTAGLHSKNCFHLFPMNKGDLTLYDRLGTGKPVGADSFNTFFQALSYLNPLSNRQLISLYMKSYGQNALSHSSHRYQEA